MQTPNDFVHGNYEDKYNSNNIISKFLVSNFFQHFHKTLSHIDPSQINNIAEIGCGEGEIIKKLHAYFNQETYSACDLSEIEIEKAKNNNKDINVQYSVQNAENLTLYQDQSFDLVVCSEVLEHLEHPDKGFQELLRISNQYILISVPREPIWRILNLARLKYIQDLGNTPGHLNHWNTFQLIKFIKKHNVEIIAKTYPLPWQILLLKKNRTIASIPT